MEGPPGLRAPSKIKGWVALALFLAGGKEAFGVEYERWQQGPREGQARECEGLVDTLWWGRVRFQGKRFGPYLTARRAVQGMKRGIGPSRVLFDYCERYRSSAFRAGIVGRKEHGTPLWLRGRRMRGEKKWSQVTNVWTRTWVPPGLTPSGWACPEEVSRLKIVA